MMMIIIIIIMIIVGELPIYSFADVLTLTLKPAGRSDHPMHTTAAINQRCIAFYTMF